MNFADSENVLLKFLDFFVEKIFNSFNGHWILLILWVFCVIISFDFVKQDDATSRNRLSTLFLTEGKFFFCCHHCSYVLFSFTILMLWTLSNVLILVVLNYEKREKKTMCIVMEGILRRDHRMMTGSLKMRCVFFVVYYKHSCNCLLCDTVIIHACLAVWRFSC